MKLAEVIAAYGMAGLLIAGACGRNSNADNSDTTDARSVSDGFHADRDIAMTVRSIADAIRVGEPLDTADYNYEGILTDGSGRPLYSDLRGAPGLWDIDVTSPTSVLIRNVEIGDLMPDDLEGYLMSNLGLTEANEIDSLTYKDKYGSETSVYDFSGGFLRIDVRGSSAVNGLQGAMVSITASRDLPI